jgi:transcriptional regulator with XRE-family HTH domain
MALLTREEFYKRLGQALRNLREEHGLTRKQLAEQLNQMPVDPERNLRHIAALSIIARHVRRKKRLTIKRVAERANLPVEFVRDMEAGKIWNPETYSIYCLAYGLRTAYRTFEKKVDVLSRTELDENDRPVRRKKKHASLPKSNSPLLSEPDRTEEEKP